MRRNTVEQCGFLLVLILFVSHPGCSKKEDPYSCKDVEIITREEWLARPGWRTWTMKMSLNDVIIIHTAGYHCFTKPQCIRILQFIQDYHLDDRGWEDIAYQFLVGGDGRVYEGLGWNQSGAHSINFNTVSMGIAFMGNFMEVEPSQKMLDAALNLITCGVDKRYLTPTREIHGHRDVTCTLSPGDKLYAIIRNWKNYKGGRMPKYDCSEGTTLKPAA